MFGLFKKDPLKRLNKAYDAKLLEARDAQRSGDIQGFAVLSEEANSILKQIQALQAG